MPLSTDKRITNPDTEFFLAPEHPLHRQYEALRAYFVEERPSKEAAQRASAIPRVPFASCATSSATTPTSASSSAPLATAPKRPALAIPCANL